MTVPRLVDCKLTHRPLGLLGPVADLGFSGGGDGLGDEGEGAGGGYPPPAGGPGAWPPGKFFANRRRKYAFSRPCLGSICLFHHFIV
jgi:hypothetical protein